MALYYRTYTGPRYRRIHNRRTESVEKLPVDVHADAEAYEITAVVPGLSADDLKIEILDNVVTLSGELAEAENGNGKYLLRERRYGPFERRLRLPDPIEADASEAKIENGVLVLRVPKAEEAKPRLIKVKGR